MSLFISFSQAEFAWDAPFAAAKEVSSQDSENLKIFWWNMNCGILNSQIYKKEQQNPLADNINELIASDMSPDILILGEYCPSRLAKVTQKFLYTKYSYNYHTVKSNPYKNTRNGIIVFSHFPLKLVKQRVLEGINNSKDVARMHSLLNVTTPKGDFYLLPLHLYNPWGSLSKMQLITKATGKDNDNYFQAESTWEYLNQDINLDEQPVVVIGDFNSAKNVLGFLNMASYSLFSTHFYDLGYDEETFPAATAVSYGNQYPLLRIDHAFSNLYSDSQTYVLPLKGSDHYPLLLFIK